QVPVQADDLVDEQGRVRGVGRLADGDRFADYHQPPALGDWLFDAEQVGRVDDRDRLPAPGDDTHYLARGLGQRIAVPPVGHVPDRCDREHPAVDAAPEAYFEPVAQVYLAVTLEEP